MKTHKYLIAEEIVTLWRLHKQGLKRAEVSRRIGLSGNAVDRWVLDIQASLEGGKVVRKTGKAELRTAVLIIKNNGVGVSKPVSTEREKLIKAIDDYIEAEVVNRLKKVQEILRGQL